MAKPPKRRIQTSGSGTGSQTAGQRTSSRVTPKGTVPEGTRQPAQPRSSIRPAGSARRGPSPWWVTALLFTLLGIGAVIIIINYLGFVPGGEASNVYLIVGLGVILAGFITATQLR